MYARLEVLASLSLTVLWCDIRIAVELWVRSQEEKESRPGARVT